MCSAVCTAQTNQYMKVILSKKTGKEITSYAEGYGTLYDDATKKQGIVDSSGVVTFESPHKGNILHVFKNRFILYSEDSGAKRKSAVIDEKGNEIIPLSDQDFNTPWWHKERIISSRQGKDAVYDFSGKEIVPYSDRIRFSGKTGFFVLKDKKWYLYDLNGSPVSDRGFKSDYNFENGRALIVNEDNQSEIIDRNGNTLHTFSQQISDISAYPYVVTRNKVSGKYGLIDAEGNTIADEVFTEINPEYFGKKEFIYLRKGNKTTVFTKKNQKLYPVNFKYLNPLFGNLFSVYSDKTEKSGIIDLNGNILVPQEYDFIKSFIVSGKDIIYLKKGTEEKVLDKDLNNILGEGVQVLGFYPQNLIIRKGEHYYTFSVADHSITELKGIDLIKGQSTDYFNPLNQFSKPIVCKNTANLYGILDGKGSEIVPFQYEDIVAFENTENEVIVKKEGKYGVINFQNELLRETIYDTYFWQKEVLILEKDRRSELIYFTKFRNKIR